MWAAAFTILALTVVIFVYTYAAVHTYFPVATGISEDLYRAKLLAGNISADYDNWIFRLGVNDTAFRHMVNVWRIAVLNATSPNGTFPLAISLGYKLWADYGKARYQLFLNVTRCVNTTKPSSEPALLYEIEMKSSIDVAPWLEVYALIPLNETEYYMTLYRLAHSPSRPAPITLGNLTKIKTEWAAVYGAVNKLYVLVPDSAVGVEIVDYPFHAVLSCKKSYGSSGSIMEIVESRHDTFPGPGRRSTPSPGHGSITPPRPLPQ